MKKRLGWLAAFAFSGLVWWVIFRLIESIAHAQTPAEMQAMQAVNAEVNQGIRYVTQDDGWENAQLLPAEGDCEDYAFSKGVLLIRSGFDPARLAFLTVRYGRQLHAVLVVDGRWVLDNVERRIVSVETARRYYRF